MNVDSRIQELETQVEQLKKQLNFTNDEISQKVDELEKEREKLKAVIKMSGDMIFEYDIASDYMIYTNTGDGVFFSGQDTKDYTKGLACIIKEEDAELGNLFAEKLSGGCEQFEVELQRMGTDKQYHWVSVIGKTLYDKNGKPEKVLGKIRNIDEQKKRELELKDKSQKDSMTGLYNHMTTKNMATERIANMQSGNVSYLIIFDIDNFKKLNDTNGHMFGDAVLCAFADEMTQLLPDAIKGRIGGDEFLVFVENMDKDELEKQFVELNNYMSENFYDDKTGLCISCSIGAVAIDGSVKDYEALFQMADNALYMVKSKGKGYYLIVDSDTENMLPHVSYLESEKNKETHERKDTLIQNDEELLLFSMELLENVSNTKSALKMIGDRTCKFFGLDDMVYVEHFEDKKEILYQWSKAKERESVHKIYEKGTYEWDNLVDKTDKQGVLIFREEQMNQMQIEVGKSIMMVFSKENSDYQGSIIFADNRADREWGRERETLVRISNQIFAHLRTLRQGERERREMDRKLNYDALTGLPVYNHFVALAEKYIEDNTKKDLYCVYSDFSNFQYLNEIFGYEAGDGVLREYAEALKTDFEKGVLFCRVTSDHFLGLVKGETVEDAWHSYWEFTCRFTERMNKFYGQCNLIISTGFYEIKDEDATVAVIMDNANEARKKCKEQRVATAIFVYTDEVKQEVENAKAMMASIVSAYNNNEFHAYLQPKVSLKTGEIVGAEALVRWVRPDGTIVMPSQFVPVSEKNGFITKIDFAVLDCVMQYLKEAIDSGEKVVPISVNFSRRHNEFEGFVPSICKWLQRYSVPSGLLEAELTESVFSSDLNRLSMNIEELRDRGVEVSVDDFGSGYSSLNLLSHVSVDTIKLDRLFLVDTLNTAKGENALTIIKYLIRMLKRLGFKVLAEGVETKEQVEMLKKADCDIAQGFYFSKPMPIPEFREFLKNYNWEDV